MVVPRNRTTATWPPNPCAIVSEALPGGTGAPVRVWPRAWHWADKTTLTSPAAPREWPSQPLCEKTSGRPPQTSRMAASS